jgi:methylthioribose-1-phosphate isomerase
MSEPDPVPRAVSWWRGRVRLVDQRLLPGRLEFRHYRTVDGLIEAIQSLAVRGAPSLGAAGAYGVALAAYTETDKRAVRAAAAHIAAARPTAVNLAWGVEEALVAFEAGGEAAALSRADQIADAEVHRNRQMGGHGAALLGDDAVVITHCNTGGLAAVEYGTALGVVRAAHERGQRPSVLVDETRPLLQGARLTAWELDRLAIPARLVIDSAAASFMAAGEVDAVLVGADRIAANGDVANKIGTYSLAVVAAHHGVPFYAVAPTTTIDAATASGNEIVVEERDSGEVTSFAAQLVAPSGFPARNPAFDVTPAKLVTGIVTEQGVARAPYKRALASHLRAAASVS